MHQTLTAITTRSASLEAFQLLKRTLTEGAEIFEHHQIGWQGGSRPHDAYWQEKQHFWSVLEQSPPDNKKGPRHRFWNCFGLDSPGKRSMLTITVEINPPHEGVDRRLGGLFVHDEGGQLYIAHTGKVGGGRAGIGKKAFRQFFQDREWHAVDDGRGLREVLVLGPIGTASFVDQVAKFVFQVADFKGQIVPKRP